MSISPASPAASSVFGPSSPGESLTPTWLASVVADRAGQILVACGLLALALIVLVVGLWYYRRHWVHVAETSGTPWTFEEIRAMRDRGDLTEEEYQALRAQLIGLVSATAPPEPAKTVKPHEVDPSGETVWRFDLEKFPPG